MNKNFLKSNLSYKRIEGSKNKHTSNKVLTENRFILALPIEVRPILTLEKGLNTKKVIYLQKIYHVWIKFVYIYFLKKI